MHGQIIASVRLVFLLLLPLVYRVVLSRFFENVICWCFISIVFFQSAAIAAFGKPTGASQSVPHWFFYCLLYVCAFPYMYTCACIHIRSATVYDT